MKIINPHNLQKKELKDIIKIIIQQLINNFKLITKGKIKKLVNIKEKIKIKIWQIINFITEYFSDQNQIKKSKDN